MSQPVKKISKTKKSKNKKNKKDVTKDVRIPVKDKMKSPKKWKPYKGSGKHPAYGTSKLEGRFAREFLDKLGLRYIYQYKMESIGRYLDFMVVDDLEHPSVKVAVEVDGDFYHRFGLTYEQMNPMQKKNRRVDEEKNEWCARNGIPLIRIWENEINKKPDEVLNWLKGKLGALINNKDKRIKPKVK